MSRSGSLRLERVVEAIESPWKAPFDGSLRSAPDDFEPPEHGDDYRQRLKQTRKSLRPFQRKLHAGRQYGLLLVFQALDAAGKDGVIREVFEDLDPVNVRVSAFKQPSSLELRHDFLWRTGLMLPERGNIAVFNRSYYEEVLVVRVHPELLDAQYAGAPPAPELLWPERYRAIRAYERHLACANTLILKFWLNVSPARQARRFLERLDNPGKRWKFSLSDVRESTFREAYDEALLHMLNETSRSWAPWFCVPADDKWYLRWQVVDIIRQAMAALPLDFPDGEALSDQEAAEVRALLQGRLKTAAPGGGGSG